MDEPLDSSKPVFADEAKPDTNEDALFTDMPAWLSIVDETVSPESIPAPITNTDAIAPGDLPSWVQAMRPVDAGVPLAVSASLSSDKKLEASGALAGLQGVLPAVNGLFPHQQTKSIFDHDEGKRRTTGACGIVGANPCGRDRTCSP